MHSSLVGALKVVLASSAYLGLTNSGITPFVFSRFSTYSANLKTRVLVFPGKYEKPCSLGTSPPFSHLLLSKGSN
jgi:hypothetical protein